MSKAFNRDRRKNDRSVRPERRTARVVSCLATDLDDVLYVILELDPREGLQTPWILLSLLREADRISWSVEFRDSQEYKEPEKFLTDEPVQSVLLEDQDVKCILAATARINRFLGANFYVSIPDAWVDSVDTGKEEHHE